MTKTFENGPHVAVGAPSQSSSSPPTPPAGIVAAGHEAPGASSRLPVRSKAVYNAVCTTSTSTSGSAVLMSTTETNHLSSNTNTNSLAEEDSVTNLDELKLRALLDEAITYKTPKDREGKSKLFNTLLIDAEDDLRKEHAHNASGPARHFSSTAKKRHRQRRQPSSVSENLTHGGSLNDLAKQELYEYESAKAARPKTVSTRQREGGSLPCNVNAGAPHVDKAYFMEERARQQEQRNMRSSADVHSALGIDYPPLEPASTYISQASIPITAKVDDPLSFAQFVSSPAVGQMFGQYNPETSGRLTKRIPIQHVSCVNRKKLDENDNTLTQSGGGSGSAAGNIIETGDNASSLSSATACAKRKSKQKKPIENVIKAKDIKGHRSDIIENIDMLVSFIEGTEDKGKKKLHKQHSHTLTSEDKNKKRTRKKSTTMLQKSNSMEEMSTTKLEDFSFEALDVKEKAPLRPTKSNADRSSRLHKGWVVSSEQLQMPTSNNSAENVEIADFIYVTKKKKSKKRRNSFGSRGNPPQSAAVARPAEFHSLRVSSPRRKSASSAPHSEKSADSSDNESVHSLPLDGENKSHQISYADIAKCSERPKWNRLPSERRKAAEKPSPPIPAEEKPVDIPQAAAVVSPVSVAVQTTTTPPPASLNTNTAVPLTVHFNSNTAPESNKEAPKVVPKDKETDTDLSSLQNWPEIRNNKVNQAKTNNVNSLRNSGATAPDPQVQQPVQDWPSIITNGAKQQQHQQSHAKPPNDNKAKKGKPLPPQSTNEHIQQILQVSNHPQTQAQDAGVCVFRQNTNEQEDTADRSIVNNPQQVIQQVSEQSHLYQMPPNIRDVQSIEEMQMRSLQAAQISPALAEEETVDYVPYPAATEKYRPAVVILTSGGDRDSTSDITFGFGINEQLLSGDVCADFVSRFVQPDLTTQVSTHVDQLVNYVGSEWESVLMQTRTGKVKYYTDELS